MSTQYLALQPLGEPFDLGELGDEGRVQYAANFLALKRPSATFEQELIAVLVAAGVGVEGQTIFATSKATIPTGPGPFLGLRATAGAPPLGTHTGGAAAYRRPGVQLLVVGAKAAAVIAMVHAAYDAFVGVRNQAVSA